MITTMRDTESVLLISVSIFSFRHLRKLSSQKLKVL